MKSKYFYLSLFYLPLCIHCVQVQIPHTEHKHIAPVPPHLTPDPLLRPDPPCTMHHAPLGTPLSFIVSVFVDNCNSQHSSLNRIAARGETALGEPVEPDVSPEPGAASFNGVPDLYRFRFDGFGEGDHIKVRLNGQAGRVKDGGGASFGGLLFDLP